MNHQFRKWFVNNRLQQLHPRGRREITFLAAIPVPRGRKNNFHLGPAFHRKFVKFCVTQEWAIIFVRGTNFTFKHVSWLSWLVYKIL
jgi:hypothetical protein